MIWSATRPNVIFKTFRFDIVCASPWIVLRFASGLLPKWFSLKTFRRCANVWKGVCCFACQRTSPATIHLTNLFGVFQIPCQATRNLSHWVAEVQSLSFLLDWPNDLMFRMVHLKFWRKLMTVILAQWPLRILDKKLRFSEPGTHTQRAVGGDLRESSTFPK